MTHAAVNCLPTQPLARGQQIDPMAEATRHRHTTLRHVDTVFAEQLKPLNDG
jgi:hypothetical protein